MFQVGAAKVDITVYDEGMCMLGWGHPQNTAEGVAMPLHARAVVVEDERGNKIAYLCAELCFVSLLLRRRVMALLGDQPELGLGEHNTVLAATHTHSGPNGYSGDLYYDITAPGFSDRVFRTLGERFVLALREADRRRRPARAFYGTGEIPLTEAVMFNRSTGAYNRNADVTPVSPDRSDEALDRTIRVVRFDDGQGRPVAAMHWLALHGTAIHSDNRRLHPDLHGIAADRIERWARDRHGATDFVAVFAQGASGDATPNYRLDRRRRIRVSRYDDDLRSAEYCGAVVERAARGVLEAAPSTGVELRGPVEGVVRYTRFAGRRVEAKFTDGVSGRVTTEPRLGISMALGTDEGHGPLYGFGWLTDALRDRRARAGLAAGDARAEDPKVPFVNLAAGEGGLLFDAFPVATRLLAALPAPGMPHFRKLLLASALGRDWAPSVLPVQLVRVGALVIAALPCEPTTVAGRRLWATLSTALGTPASHVVVNGYANAYAQYLTTAEEYREQHYEAGCTLFGPWTLAAFQAELSSLVDVLRDGSAGGDLGDEVPLPNVAQTGVGRFVIQGSKAARRHASL
jgi:neutral ceramidase